MAQFELYRDNRKEYRWRLKAANGRIMADSGEGYVNKSDCESAIRWVQANASGATVDDQTVARAASAYRW